MSQDAISSDHFAIYFKLICSNVVLNSGCFLICHNILIIFMIARSSLDRSCSKFLYIFKAWYYYDAYIDACLLEFTYCCDATPFHEHHLEINYKCLENVCYFGWGPANFRSCLVAFDDREASTQTEPLNWIWDGGRVYSWVNHGFLVSYPSKLPDLLFVADAGSVRPTHGTSSATAGEFWLPGKWVR